MLPFVSALCGLHISDNGLLRKSYDLMRVIQELCWNQMYVVKSSWIDPMICAVENVSCIRRYTRCAKARGASRVSALIASTRSQGLHACNGCRLLQLNKLTTALVRVMVSTDSYDSQTLAKLELHPIMPSYCPGLRSKFQRSANPKAAQ